MIQLIRLDGSSAEAAVAQENFVFEHPVLALLQTWSERADPVNYAHLWFASPRAGSARAACS